MLRSLVKAGVAVIMTNSDNGAALAAEIMRSIGAEYGWPDHKLDTQNARQHVPKSNSHRRLRKFRQYRDHAERQRQQQSHRVKAGNLLATRKP